MKRVVVGISGGVDSAVAALLLKKQGYEVIGLFMRNWDSSINNDIEGNPNINNEICPQESDYNDAVELCKILNIPLHRVDFIKEYWDNVFTYFLEELKLGRTPNPDLMCNKFIKFDLFIKAAKELGANYIATGHYAIIKNNELYKSKDLNKDQSYFLSYVPINQFNNVLFPIGDLTKEEVRKIAMENNLNVASKKDSTGICFIGERNYQKFIKNYLKNNPGDIIDIETKKIIGKHNGLMNYTIGQRRNIGISGYKEKHYVCGKDTKKNILYVSFRTDNKYLISYSCIINKINYLSNERPEKCMAKFRYRDIDHEVNLIYHNDYIEVKMPSGVTAVTPGQACVLYNNDKCIISGIIDSTDNSKYYL